MFPSAWEALPFFWSDFVLFLSSSFAFSVNPFLAFQIKWGTYTPMLIALSVVLHLRSHRVELQFVVYSHSPTSLNLLRAGASSVSLCNSGTHQEAAGAQEHLLNEPLDSRTSSATPNQGTSPLGNKVFLICKMRRF